MLRALCERLDRPSLFTADSCFVSTRDSFAANESNWRSLHTRCLHLGAPLARRLAFVRTRDELRALVERRVVEASDDRNRAVCMTLVYSQTAAIWWAAVSSPMIV